MRIAKEVPAKCPSTAEEKTKKAVPPVWVYTWHRYHGVDQQLLSDGDERMYWEESYAAGATGLVLWGNEPTNASAKEFGAWWKSTFTGLINSWRPAFINEVSEQL